MHFCYEVKTEKDAEKLAGLVFFDSDENEDAAFEISGEYLSEGYSADNGGYDYDECDCDADHACRVIKRTVGENARVMYVSQEDEGSGECSYIWSDFGETGIHSVVMQGRIFMDDCDGDEWRTSVKELLEDNGERDYYDDDLDDDIIWEEIDEDFDEDEEDEDEDDI